MTTSSALDAEPDWGARIAFTSSRAGNGDIYVMQADGTGQTRVTAHNATDVSPAWSPDESKLVFTTNRDGSSNFELYSTNPDGTGAARLTDHTSADLFPDW